MMMTAVNFLVLCYTRYYFKGFICINLLNLHTSPMMQILLYFLYHRVNWDSGWSNNLPKIHSWKGLKPRFEFSLSVSKVCFLNNYNLEAKGTKPVIKKVKIIYIKRGKGLLDGEKPESIKEEAGERKVQEGRNFVERSWGNLEHFRWQYWGGTDLGKMGERTILFELCCCTICFVFIVRHVLRLEIKILILVGLGAWVIFVCDKYWYCLALKQCRFGWVIMVMLTIKLIMSIIRYSDKGKRIILDV